MGGERALPRVEERRHRSAGVRRPALDGPAPCSLFLLSNGVGRPRWPIGMTDESERYEVDREAARRFSSPGLSASGAAYRDCTASGAPHDPADVQRRPRSRRGTCVLICPRMVRSSDATRLFDWMGGMCIDALSCCNRFWSFGHRTRSDVMTCEFAHPSRRDQTPVKPAGIRAVWLK